MQVQLQKQGTYHSSRQCSDLALPHDRTLHHPGFQHGPDKAEHGPIAHLRRHAVGLPIVRECVELALSSKSTTQAYPSFGEERAARPSLLAN